MDLQKITSSDNPVFDTPGLYLPQPGEVVTLSWRHPESQLDESILVGQEVLVSDAWVPIIASSGLNDDHSRFISLIPNGKRGGWCRVQPIYATYALRSLKGAYETLDAYDVKHLKSIRKLLRDCCKVALDASRVTTNADVQQSLQRVGLDILEINATKY